MSTAQVTVQYVNQPNKNPKYGSIKTAELGYVSVPAENLNQFSQGEVCTINYSTNPKGYHNLNQKVAAAAPAPAMNGHAPAPVANNHPSGPMGMVNAFISIGAVALDVDTIAEAIRKCRAGHAKGWE